MERIFRDLKGLLEGPIGDDIFRSFPGPRLPYKPTVYSRETKDEVVYTVDLPGVHLADVRVSVQKSSKDGNFLVITATRKVDPGVQVNFKHFVEHIVISDSLREEDISARLADGVLTITVKKIAQANTESVFNIPVRV